jgi:hypothetical protein
MQVDHGGLEPPTVNPKPRTTMGMLLARSRANLKKLAEAREKDQQQVEDNSRKITAKLKLADRNNKDCCHLLTSPRTAQSTRAEKRKLVTKNEIPARAQSITPLKEPESSPNKSRLIALSTKFPDPKNCAIFLQHTTQEDAPCWFHKKKKRTFSRVGNCVT